MVSTTPWPLYPPGKTRYPLYRRLGRPQGRSGRVRKISPPTGIRSPDRAARSESLYRLNYPGPYFLWLLSGPYHSAHNLLSSNLISKKILRLSTYRIITLPVVLHGCEIWSLTEEGTLAEGVGE